MSEGEGFLTRWARRKHEAAEKASESRADAVTNRALADDETAAGSSPQVPEVDLSKLPPLESISASTDIQPFLTRGVPAELTRAALRRAWSADPAIRDFVGLAENQWDFTAADSIPGFGPIRPEDLRHLLAEVMGESREVTAQTETPSSQQADMGQITEKSSIKSDEYDSSSDDVTQIPSEGLKKNNV